MMKLKANTWKIQNMDLVLKTLYFTRYPIVVLINLVVSFGTFKKFVDHNQVGIYLDINLINLET